MTVYSYRIMTDITASLNNIANNMINKMPLVLHPGEFIAAMINPEHVDKLNEVKELVGFIGQPNVITDFATSSGITIPVYGSFRENAPIIIPRYVSGGLQPTCPDSIRDKVTAWADERYRIGVTFGDAIDAVSYLNEVCSDSRAMALLLPAITTIMAKFSDNADDKMVKRAQKLNNAAGFGKLPRLPPAVKERLKDISAMVNVAALMDDAKGYTLNKNDVAFLRNNTYSIDASRHNIFDVMVPEATPALTRTASFV